ncbi:MAG: hypothetical protein BWY63_02247 [Chloroflexi bacterium ADurb.Bin360]|nr:MAG: hypothetical protein BWY63_02247 [Chloroflexi bacterium ADurb.Bin360]
MPYQGTYRQNNGVFWAEWVHPCRAFLFKQTNSGAGAAQPTVLVGVKELRSRFHPRASPCQVNDKHTG